MHWQQNFIEKSLGLLKLRKKKPSWMITTPKILQMSQYCQLIQLYYIIVCIENNLIDIDRAYLLYLEKMLKKISKNPY